VTDALNWLRLGLSGTALVFLPSWDAAYFVVSMSLYAVRWLIIAVVIYTSIHMLWQRPKSP
jgi:hypothetical protein